MAELGEKNFQKIEYWRGQCAASEKMCPRKGCPFGDYYECKDFCQQIKSLIQNQPEVDYSFINKWADKLERRVKQRWTDDTFVGPSGKELIQMLTEANVKVKSEQSKQR